MISIFKWIHRIEQFSLYKHQATDIHAQRIACAYYIRVYNINRDIASILNRFVEANEANKKDLFVNQFQGGYWFDLCGTVNGKLEFIIQLYFLYLLAKTSWIVTILIYNLGENMDHPANSILLRDID